MRHKTTIHRARIAAIVFLSLNVSAGVALSQTTDTLYAVRGLDAEFMHWYTLDSAYMVWPGPFGCGDGIDAIFHSGVPFSWRGGLSFDLSQIQTDTVGKKLLSAILSVYQIQSYGNGKPNVFPIFGNQPGRFPCVLDHVDYGETLEWWDWFVGKEGDPGSIHRKIGIVSNTPDVGFRRVDITQHILEDLNAGKKLSQYLLRFDPEFDTDSLEDFLEFRPLGYYLELRTGWPAVILEWQPVTSRALIQEDNMHSFSLSSYPNPFNPTTRISYQIPKSAHVDINIYDVLGHEIARMVNENQPQGSYSVSFDGSLLPSGLYFCRLTAGEYSKTIKLMKAK
jgi:hypothetical protein